MTFLPDLVDFERRHREIVLLVVCPRCYAKKGEICTQRRFSYQSSRPENRWREPRSHVLRAKRLFRALTTTDLSEKRRLTRGS